MKNQEIEWLLKEKYRGEKAEGFGADCERLAAGEPLGYIIGHVPFLNCAIYLDSKPLIPRPETEFWTEKAIAAIREAIATGAAPSAPRILDLCAGSGAIGVAVAKAIPGAEVTFIEIDPRHLPTINKNLTTNLSNDPCLAPTHPGSLVTTNQKPFIRMKGFSVVASDLFEKMPEPGAFDFILSNPPYIDVAADTVETSVVANEPHLALFGGENGMEIIARIIEGARAQLAPHGALWLEHEPFQTEAIQKISSQNGFTCNTKHDQYGTNRYSVLTFAVSQ